MAAATNWLTRINPFRKREERSAIDNLERDFAKGTGWPASSGRAVSEKTALAVSAVYACVRTISENIAGLPLKVRVRTASGSEEAPQNHPVARLLGYSPNESDTPFDFMSAGNAQIELRGNAYFRIVRNSFSEVSALLPISSADIEPRRLVSGATVYDLRGESKPLTSLDILHVRSLSTDGVKGLSVLRQARESIGTALATEEHGAKFFANSANPGGALEFPAGTTPEQATKFLAKWKSEHSGAGNAYKVAGLVGGIKFQPFSISNEDAQFLATRQFQVEDIARFYGVPLFLLQSTEKSTSWGTGMGELQAAFLKFTLLPRLINWEQRLTSALLSEADKAAGYYVTFNLQAFQRATLDKQVDSLRIGIESGIYSLNEARRYLGLNELPDAIGGIHVRPSSLVPVGQSGATTNDAANVQQ